MKACRGRKREIATLEGYLEDMNLELGHRVLGPKSDQNNERIPKLIESMNKVRRMIMKERMK